MYQKFEFRIVKVVTGLTESVFFFKYTKFVYVHIKYKNYTITRNIYIVKKNSLLIQLKVTCIIIVFFSETKLRVKKCIILFYFFRY